ncbi:hypothetical protein EAH_00032290, partial [Eimeria acervulina]
MTQIHLPADADLQDSLATLYPHNLTTTLPPHPLKHAVSRGREVLQRGPRRTKFLVGAVVCIVSLVTLVALLAVCRSIQRRVSHGAATPRNLSDTAEDQERSGILDQCLDLEAEHGIWGAGFEDSGDATEAKARLVSMLQVSSAAFEHMQILTSQGSQDEAHSPLSKFPRLDESWQSTSHPGVSAGRFGSDRSGGEVGSASDHFSADAWRADPAWPAFGEEGQQGLAAGASGMQGPQWNVSESRTSSSGIYEQEVITNQGAFSSVGSATSSEDPRNPAAWLDYHSGSMYPQALQHSAVDTALQKGFQDEAHSPLSKIPRLDESWQSTSHPGVSAGRFGSDRSGGEVGSGFDPFSADAWTANPAWPVLGEEGQQVQAAGASGMQGPQWNVSESRTSSSGIYEQEVITNQGAFSSVGSATSSEDPRNPAAWLDYHSGSMYPQALQHSAVGTALQNPTVDAASLASTDTGSFGTDSPAGTVGRGNFPGGFGYGNSVLMWQAEIVQQRGSQAQAANGTLDASEISESARGGPVTSGDERERCNAPDIRQHPFVRLPEVNPESICTKFCPSRALLIDLNVTGPMGAYTTIRELFAKPSLTAADVDLLVTNVENL